MYGVMEYYLQRYKTILYNYYCLNLEINYGLIMAYCIYVLDTRNNYILRYSKYNTFQLSSGHRHTHKTCFYYSLLMNF